MRLIWRFLNSRVIALLLAEGVFIGAVYLLVSGIPLFSHDEERRTEALSHMELITMTTPTNNEGRVDRCVGTIKNGSDYVISDLDVALCLFDASNEISDVIQQRMSTVGLLPPGQEANFSLPLIQNTGESNWRANWRNGDGKIELRFIDLRATTGKK